MQSTFHFAGDSAASPINPKVKMGQCNLKLLTNYQSSIMVNPNGIMRIVYAYNNSIYIYFICNIRPMAIDCHFSNLIHPLIICIFSWNRGINFFHSLVRFHCLALVIKSSRYSLILLSYSAARLQKVLEKLVKVVSNKYRSDM